MIPIVARVFIESPYAGDVERNVLYARRALKHSLICGEAPFASHLLYTQPGVLNDANRDERDKGLAAGTIWRSVSDYIVVYTDYGVSNGMQLGILESEMANKPVVYRSIGKNP